MSKQRQRITKWEASIFLQSVKKYCNTIQLEEWTVRQLRAVGIKVRIGMVSFLKARECVKFIRFEGDLKVWSITSKGEKLINYSMR